MIGEDVKKRPHSTSNAIVRIGPITQHFIMSKTLSPNNEITRAEPVTL